LADHDALYKMVRHVLLRPLAKSTAVTIKWSRREVTSVVGLYCCYIVYNILETKLVGPINSILELPYKVPLMANFN
jgi:dolichyl-phosphate-mannose--protein O-mannosyl transferase